MQDIKQGVLIHDITDQLQESNIPGMDTGSFGVVTELSPQVEEVASPENASPGNVASGKRFPDASDIFSKQNLNPLKGIRYILEFL